MRIAASGAANRARSSAFGPAAALFLLLTLLMALRIGAAAAQVPARAPDRVLTGTATGADHRRYLRAPFDLPEGVDRLVVAFEHDGGGERTVIDLGIEDPNGFRGASGGNKPNFTIAASDATPSYLAGPLVPGEWALALAVPNARSGATAHWTARLWFLRGAEAQVLPSPTEGRGPGWYRGDLHLHSGHSDGSCDSRGGRRVPCPLYRTLDAAAARGLDFVALTEHNTMSHAQALRELAPYYDDLLLIPGREITTFFGHFNVFGVTAPIDFRIAAGIDNGFDAIADRVHALGGIVSINHPRLPSGEACMGCGWTMPSFDWRKVDAIEAVNGASSLGGAEGPVAGTPFWIEALARGHAVTAVGGSDNHDADRTGAGAVGVPTTVVRADDLSQQAILAGIRAGRVFVDIDGTGAVHLDFTVRAGSAQATMGGTLDARGADLSIEAEVRGPEGALLELWDGDNRLAAQPIAAGRVPAITLPARPGTRILRVQLRSAGGRLLALGNAVTVHGG